jgi:two-component system response regulator
MANQPIEILLVEDDPDDVELTLRALQPQHLASKVHVLHDGAEALDYLFADASTGRRTVNDPKVILLDLKLPKVGGLEVLQRLKSDPRTRLIPVVILSSSREDRDVRAGYQLGVNSYIVKPVDFGQFTEAIRSLGLYWVLLNQTAM